MPGLKLELDLPQCSETQPKITIVSPSECRPTIPQGADLTPTKTILLYGAGGSLVRRFLASDFNKIRFLFPNVYFIAVDIYPDGNNILTSVPLPWLNGGYITTSDLVTVTDRSVVLIGDKQVQVDGVYAAVPPDHHLTIAKQWAERVSTAIEKPLSRVHELVAMVQLFQGNKDRLVPIDFFADSDALRYTIQEKLYEKIGTLSQIEGRCIERWPIEEGREWLVADRNKSGGGLGMDMVVHPAHLGFLFAQLSGNKLRATVDQAVLARYQQSDNTPAPGNLETYLWLKGHIGNITVLFDGGKGLETTYYGIRLTGDRGSLEIFTGSEVHEPYLLLRQANGNPPQIWQFPGGGVGYTRTLTDFLLKVYGIGQTVSPDNGMRFRSSLHTVDMIGKAYKLSQNDSLLSHGIGQAVIVPQPLSLTVSPFAQERKS